MKLEKAIKLYELWHVIGTIRVDSIWKPHTKHVHWAFIVSTTNLHRIHWNLNDFIFLIVFFFCFTLQSESVFTLTFYPFVRFDCNWKWFSLLDWIYRIESVCSVRSFAEREQRVALNEVCDECDKRCTCGRFPNWLFVCVHSN